MSRSNNSRRGRRGSPRFMCGADCSYCNPAIRLGWHKANVEKLERREFAHGPGEPTCDDGNPDCEICGLGMFSCLDYDDDGSFYDWLDAGNESRPLVVGLVEAARIKI